MKLKLLICSVLAMLLACGNVCHASRQEQKRNVAPDTYNFWLYTPDEYDGKQPLPVVIFLHGRSLCGHDLNKVLRYGTLDAIKRGLILPCIVIAPQNPGEAWKPYKIINILNWVAENYTCDTTRVYALGMSLGGFGTMDLAGAYPDKIAAAMALCGGCYLKDQDGLGGLPLWIIHGTADRLVSINESKKVVRRMQDNHLDGRLRYDWLPGASHGALARAFYLKDTYDWLLSHSLGDPDRPVNRYVDIDNAILKQAYGELRELSRLLGDDGLMDGDFTEE